MPPKVNHSPYKNAVLDDKELQAALTAIHPKFGDFVTRVAGEVWGLPLIPQKTKALITIAVDVVNQNHTGAGNPFAAHLDMAQKQGVTPAQIEELLLFLCVYAGFNKVAGCLGTLNQIWATSNFEPRRLAMIATMTKKADYAIRDQQGKAAFYVLLWKRKGISLELFDDYWRNVHGPVCARLPGQHQYWQFHVAHNQGGIWPEVKGVDYIGSESEQFDGIAELTFTTEAERQIWFKAAGILMDDEHNLFSKAIGYNSSPGNSITYIDGIADGEPNGELGILKFHVLLKKSDAVTVPQFRKYLTDIFAPAVIKNDSVLKFRLHLFEEVDNSRPDAAGVSHYEPAEKQYQAAFEIAFSNNLEMEKFFASQEYAQATETQAKYVKQVNPFPERTAYTFVYDGQMTLAGQRGSKVAQLINNIGATNQLKSDISSLMLGTSLEVNTPPVQKSGLGHLLQGIQHFGVTVEDMDKSLEFYTEVLGGKYVVEEKGMVGDQMQNTLFQAEELQAIAKGVTPASMGIPNLRDAKEALDVKFISFGNACVELIYFRDPSNPNSQKTTVGKAPSQIGNVNAMHLSFQVKDDVDLNVFAKTLEDECQKRGMTNVIFNRVIRVNSEAERRAIALKYNSTKFWDDPELLAQGQPPTHYGDFEGWSLFYCKGPNGEQLEFNQVTRKVKERFAQARNEYNQANGTSFGPKNNGQILSPEQLEIMSKTATASPALNGNSNGTAALSVPTMPLTNSGTTPTIAEKMPGKNTDLVLSLFSRGEAFDSAGFVTFFTDKPLYQFGNFEVCLDKASIQQSADNFFSQISAVYHEIKMIWEVGDVVFVEMDVTYWRKDGSVVSLPCADIFRVEGDKFSELRIFMDVNPVFDPTIPVPSTSSVLTISEGKKLIPPGTMRKFFAEHPEGQKRVAAGFVPKWSIAGPKWQIVAAEKTNLIPIVEKMVEALTVEDWESFYPYFTPNLLYKIGANPPVYGSRIAAEHLARFYTIVKPTQHNVRGAWQMGDDTVIIEMDAHYRRIQDGKMITVPCTDIYRFEGELIKEWRVYPDVAEVFGQESLSIMNDTNTNTNKNAVKKRINYYQDLSADYSRPGLVTPYVAKKLLEDAEKYISMKERTLPEIGPNYTLAQIEQENKDWWPTHCEALRQGRGDLLTGEYRDDLVYLCQDGPYQGLEQQKEREKHWWALIAQPGVTMCWPIVMFKGEVTYFEWKCVDDETNETLAKGNVTWVRRGHRGACHLKTEQLTFYRDVYAPNELLSLITTAS